MNTTTQQAERYYQVCRFDLDGKLVALYAPCVDERHSEAMLRVYNSTAGLYRLRRRRIDVASLPAVFNPSDMPSDLLGEWEGGAA